MNRFKYILAAVVVGGLAAVIALQHEIVAKRRQENKLLRDQLAQLTQAQSERDSVVHSSPETGGTKENQLAELLKLRGEVTQLRTQTNAIIALRQENDRLIAALQGADGAQGKPAKMLPEDVPPQDIHPRNLWGYRGYDSPDSTLESLLWAISKGDRASFAAGMPKEMQQVLARQLEGKDFSAAMGKRENQTREFRILGRQIVSESNRTMTVYTTREVDGKVDHRTDDLEFIKEDGQWKLFPND